MQGLPQNLLQHTPSTSRDFWESQKKKKKGELEPSNQKEKIQPPLEKVHSQESAKQKQICF
jgi:hypothetical protein